MVGFVYHWHNKLHIGEEIVVEHKVAFFFDSGSCCGFCSQISAEETTNVLVRSAVYYRDGNWASVHGMQAAILANGTIQLGRVVQSPIKLTRG